MKTVIVTIALLIGGTIQAQDAISKYFSYLEKDTTMSSVTVNSKMFELFANVEATTPEEKEFIEMLKNIKSLKMVMNENPKNGKSLFETAVKKPGKEFESLMEVNTDGEMFRFLIQEKNGVVSEFLMIGFSAEKGGSPKFIVLSLLGDIDLKYIGKLGNLLRINEMKHLEKSQSN